MTIQRRIIAVLLAVAGASAGSLRRLIPVPNLSTVHLSVDRARRLNPKVQASWMSPALREGYLSKPDRWINKRIAPSGPGSGRDRGEDDLSDDRLDLEQQKG